MNNDNNNVPQTLGQNQPQNTLDPASPTTVTTQKPNGSRRNLILALVGIVVLVAGVGAGIFLISQNQDFRSRAGEDCSGIDNPSVTSPITLPEGCSISGTRFKGTAPSSANEDGDCVGYSENNSGFSATGPTTISLNPSCGQCEQVDFVVNGTSYGTAKYGGSCEGGGSNDSFPGLCDNACTKNSDCADVSPAGAELECNTSIGKCVNKLCPNDTIEGNNCSCATAVQGCGEPCGGGYPLCGDGYQCRYITGSVCTVSSNANPTTYCIPHPPPGGYSVPKCVSRDTGNSYVKRDSDEKSTWTAEEINQEFCTTPQATDEPVATEEPATEVLPVKTISAQCLNIRVFDTEWDELSRDDMEALSGGDVIRFAVAGSSDSGEFVAARFTIDGVLGDEVTDKRPTGTEFYYEYTIPEGASGFNVDAEIKHSELGWF